MTGYVTKLFDNARGIPRRYAEIDNEFNITSNAGNVKGDYWKGEAGYTYSFEGHSRSLSEDLAALGMNTASAPSFNATKNLHLYADIEAADGGEVDTDYRVNLGARWSFWCAH